MRDNEPDQRNAECNNPNSKKRVSTAESNSPLARFATRPDRRTLLRMTGVGILSVTSTSSIMASVAATNDQSDPTEEQTLIFTRIDGEVYAVDRETGDIEWTFEGDTHRPFQSLTSAEDTLLAASTEMIYAIDPETGEDYWSITDDALRTNNELTVADGMIFVRADGGAIRAYNAETGDQEWESAQPNKTVQSPMVAANGLLYATTDDRLYAIEADSGRSEWVVPEAGDFTDYGPDFYPPVVSGTTLLLSSEYHGIHGFDAITGEHQWQYSNYGITSRPSVTVGTASIVSTDADVYGETEGELIGQSVTTGDPKWKIQISETVERLGISKAIAVGNRIYVWAASSEMEAQLFAVDADSGDIDWRAPVNSPFGGWVRAIGDTVYTASGGTSSGWTAYALDRETGERYWTATGSEPDVPLEVVAQDDLVFFRFESGILYAVDRAEGTEVWNFEAPREESDGDDDDNISFDTQSSDSVPGPGIAGTLATIFGMGYLLARNESNEQK
ncbi:PQQ-binding-like beta-propeller repeat protein [Natrinema sp. H-ect4]|uniref:outer membrane protein assembly factor BamB family protein n=1 Tax=Natrinema sp. H-ect4 TaxID=3242699 RepID=UPI0035A92365